MKHLIVSVHDVTPFYKKQLIAIFRGLDKLKLFKRNLLIVPNWRGKYPISNDLEFMKLIRREDKRGSHLVLHGYEHEGNTPKLLRFLYPEFHFGFEFRRLDYENAKKIIAKSLEEYRKVFKHKPNGFIAPSWSMSTKGIVLLKELGFKYTTTLTKIIDLQKNIAIRTWANGFDRFGEGTISPFISRNFSRVHIGLQTILNANIIRFTIHPGDVIDHNYPLEIPILRELLEKGYSTTTYEEILR